jgi:hypothetical protein
MSVPRPLPFRMPLQGHFMTPPDSPALRFLASNRWPLAGWSATTFRWHPVGHAPPVLGLVFDNRAAAEDLFLRWVEEHGNADPLDELRVSVIEGDIPGQAPGYTLHLCPDPDGLRARATADGVALDETTPLAFAGRANRMHPIPGVPPMLPRFKEQYEKHGEYLLAPVTRRDDGQLWFDVELGIVKRKICFRTAAEVPDGDLDAPLVRPAVALAPTDRWPDPG